MAMRIEVTHSGGKKVDARVGGFTIRTDQAREGGGEGTAPEPFTLFLSSLATCVGIYIVGFCQVRDIPTSGLRIVQDHRFDEKTGRLLDVRMTIALPPGFPDKYRAAVVRVASQCTVKRVLERPPEFSIETQSTG
jgi:ribosomal protein S12 methylthiotransferase accessory factor